MDKFQARILFVGVIAVAVIISINALFLQGGRHPAPIPALRAPRFDFNWPTFSLGRGVSGFWRQSAQVSTRKSPPVQAAKLVAAIQRELVAGGYDAGGVDGLIGVMTRAAIMAYQWDNGLPVTATASEMLLQHMLLGTVKSSAGVEWGVNDMAVKLTKSVQNALAMHGYDPGDIKGIQGRDTRRAIEQFEADRKIRVTGRVSGALVRSIKRSTGISISF